MNLITDYFEKSFEIKSNILNTLVIEDTNVFTKFLKSFIEVKNKQSEEIEIIEDLKRVDVSRTTDIIFDLFSMKANNENIIKKLNAEIEYELNSEDMYSKKIEIESMLTNIIDDLIYRSRFSLKSSEINYQNLFKAMSLEFDYDKASILECLIEYMRNASELLNKKLFIIVNLDSFLNEDELIELSKFLQYNQIKVLALQNKIIREVMSCENLRIIDKDLCEI